MSVTVPPSTCWVSRTVVAMFTAYTFLAPARARAEFGDEGYALEDLSALPLRDAELSVGTRGIALGLFGVLQVGTNFPLDLLGAPNASVKFEVLETDIFGLGLELGFLSFDRETLGFNEPLSLSAIPVTLRASGLVLEDLIVHGSVDVFVTDIEGASPDAVKRLARHFYRAPEVSFSLAAEYRFGPHVGVMTELQFPLALAPAHLRYEDEKDELDFFRAVTGVHLVFGDFNLRAGAGYGPSFLGRSSFFPVLDVTLRIH